MLSSPILEKNRQINKILQETEGPIDFAAVADVLQKVIDANVYIIDRAGTVLGYSLKNGFDCAIMIEEVLDAGSFPGWYNRFLLKDDRLRDNLRQKSDRCVFYETKQCLSTDKIISVVPLSGNGERLGTLLLARFAKSFEAEDIILSERVAAVVGQEIMRTRREEDREAARQRAMAKLALSTLSYCEEEAVRNILQELKGDKAIIVTSKIADRLGITRSVVVNAMHKLKCAGLIESSSLGMKGTHIRILNPFIFE